MAAVLGMLGLEEKDVAEGDTLESLGMDSMQVAEIRARLQRALGRPMPLEEARPLHTPSDLDSSKQLTLSVLLSNSLRLCLA